MNFLISTIKRTFLIGAAIGAFSSMAVLPTIAQAQTCGIFGIVTCSDQAGGNNSSTAPGPGPSPRSEPETDLGDDCGDCEATFE